MRPIIFLLTLCICQSINAQVGVGTLTPDPSAQLDVRSETKGFLLPRLDLSQRNNITSPAQGLIIFQKDNTPGFYIYINSDWQKLTAETAGVSAGDVKYSYQQTNHEGWYLLNGQAVSSLPATAQLNASSLGMGSSLPDTRDRVAKHSAAAGEATGSLNASNNITLARNNLPNVSLTALSSGDHSHSYQDAYWSSQYYGNHGLRGANAREDYDNARVYSYYTTDGSGSHTHTVALNGNVTQTVVDNRQASLNLNQFIYLGD